MKKKFLITVSLSITLLASFGCLEKTVTTSSEACLQGSLPPSSPQGDSLNLLNIKLYQATSEDGITFNEPEVFLTGGGVPSVTTGEDGTIVAVFQWFTDDPYAFNKVGVKISKDNGETWTEPQMICIENYPDNLQPPYDPTITTTKNGQYRLFYTVHELGTDKQFFYGSAISEDGIHYTYEDGVRFQTDTNIADGSEVRIGDTWYMIAPLAQQGVALDAISQDGLNFTEATSNRSEIEMNWLGNMTDDNGTIRFYGGVSSGIIRFIESPNGETWSEPTETNISGGDPGITITKDGQYLLIYVESELGQ